MIWKVRSEANLLPLSIEQSSLYRALLEWVYTGEMYDLGSPHATCELCEHPDLRYQFKIVNKYNGNELLVGSECITKFRITAVDESGNALGRDESRKKVARDRRCLIMSSKNKRQINALLRLAAVEHDFKISSFIDYVQDRGAFTPNQLSLLLRKFRQHGIEHDPRDFKVIIRRGREQTQLLEMPEWKRQQLLPALSPTQKKWLAEHSSNSPVTPTRDGHEHPPRCSLGGPQGTPDCPSTTHDRVGNPPAPQRGPSPIDPLRSPIDCFPPTGSAEPAQAEHLFDAAAADTVPLNSWAVRWFLMLRRSGSNMDKPGKSPGRIISEVMNVHSHKLYAVSTAPEPGHDLWTTTLLPVIQRKGLLGLFKSNVPDFKHQIIAISRHSMEEAHQVHAQVRRVVSSVTEGEWFKSFPPAVPADGYSAGVHQLPKDI